MGVAVATTTKKDLIERIASETSIRRSDVKDVVELFLHHMMEELKSGNRIEFRDFGVFEVHERAERVALNPRTRTPITVPLRRSVRFKGSRLMRAVLDGSAPLNRYQFSGGDGEK